MPESGFMGFMDWNAQCIQDNFTCADSLAVRAMFQQHRHSQMTMRWVHAADVGRPSILRLAAKYQLHPLPVEDAMQLDQEVVPLVRRYNKNLFIVIPMMRLMDAEPGEFGVSSKRSRRYSKVRLCKLPGGKPTINTQPPRINVEQGRLAMFVAGPPHFDTLIIVQSRWSTLCGEERDTVRCCAKTAGRGPDDSDDPCSPDVSTKAFGMEAFQMVARELQHNCSELRSGDSAWLLWRLIDVCVDDMMPILNAFRKQLQWYSNHIEKRAARANRNIIKELLRSKADLDNLQREVRPMQRVLKHLIADKDIDTEVHRYLEDVCDHLNTFIEETQKMAQICDSLRDEMRTYREQKQGDVLYVLAIFTVLFMPMQLLTGIYGMNFQDETGAPVVPGLGIMMEERGYWMFWGIFGVLFMMLSFIFSCVLKWF